MPSPCLYTLAPWLEAVIDSKTEAGEVQDLSVSRKHEFTTKHKHRIEEGHLQIIVMKARNIHPKTFSSELDPYVHITMGEGKATSGIASRHGLEFTLCDVYISSRFTRDCLWMYIPDFHHYDL